jgi:tetratricopeptide (TPR) repeat protein
MRLRPSKAGNLTGYGPKREAPGLWPGAPHGSEMAGVGHRERMLEITHMSDTTARPPAMGRDSRPGPERGPARLIESRSGRLRRLSRRLAVMTVLLGFGALSWLGYLEWAPPVLAEATAAYRRGDFERAQRKSTEYLARRPWSQAAALIAAQSLGALNRPGEAEPYYRRAGRLDSDLLHRRAFALVQAGLQDQAIEVYREVLSRSPDDIMALRRLAGAQILMSRWNEALQIAGQLKQIPRGEVIGYTLAGVVYHDTGRADAAVVEFERVVALDPDLTRMPLQPKLQFWVYLIKALVDLGRGSDAHPHLARALVDHQVPYLYDLLGQSFWQEGDFEAAERSWLRSIDLNPRRGQPWLLLGNLDLQRNRPGPAVERLARAAELAPSAREPYYGLSMAYGRLGRREEAAKCRSMAEQARPELANQPRGMGPSWSH